MTLSPGIQLGHYQILCPLGKGGMGEVYRAKDLRLGREVAIKVLPDRFSDDKNSLSRFEREAKALASLAHPNILSIFDFGTEEGTSYAVMEILDGETLRSLLTHSTFSWKKSVEIAIPIAEGLAAAHSKGITHRDLKPENVFVTAEGQIKILDFGLARREQAVSEEQSEAGTISRLTEPGIAVGTVPYMSPEQVRGDVVDPRSDIFSFGCMLYEMISGKHPFKGNSAADTSAAILKDDPPKIAELGKTVPIELERIISRCLEKQPDQRVQSARDLAYDLKNILGDSPATKTSPIASTGRRPTVVMVILVSVLLAGAAWWLRNRYFESRSLDKSIAVLPFRSLSSDKESEYFCDGMTEDILTQLSKIGELKVISRTSIMQYKNTNKSLKEIGKELNVAAVLEGSVRKDGNRLRIVGQLIDAKTDEHLWAETYDRELKDVFEIQSDVAQQIAHALKAKLSTTQQEQIAKQPTNNITAYDYCLKGRDYYRRYKKQDNQNAIDLFQKAIQLDPNYALAYSFLCEAQMRQPWYGFPESTSVDLAVENCNKAIAIDPSLAEAYNALQKVYGYRGWNQKAAETLKKGVELNPNYAPALINLGVTYWNQGKLDQALPLVKKSVVLDPALAFPYMTLGELYFALDDIPKAEQYLNKSLELQPDFVYPRETFVEIYLAQGRYELAREQAQKILFMDPEDNDINYYAGRVELFSGNYEKARDLFQKSLGATEIPGYKIGLGYSLWKLEQKHQAEKIFQEVLKSNRDRVSSGDENWTPLYDIAAVHAIQGNKTEAYRWLQQAIDRGALYYRLMFRDPLLENVRGGAQFQQMMSRVKARVDEMRRRAENNSLL